jgi:hypothetical protein
MFCLSGLGRVERGRGSCMLPLPPRPPSDDYGARVAACAGILFAVIAFFGIYHAITFRNAPYTPRVDYAADAERRLSELQIPPLALSEPATGAIARQDVAEAKQDVAETRPVELAKRPHLAGRKASSKKSKTAALKNGPRTRLSRAVNIRARAAFAQGFAFRPIPFGGF